MEFFARKEKDVSVVSVKGRIDAVTAPDFEKHLLELISNGDKDFIINLVTLEYISSAGLRSILSVAKKLKSAKGSLVFTGLQGPVEEVFTISGFHTIFPVYASEQIALSQMQG